MGTQLSRWSCDGEVSQGSRSEEGEAGTWDVKSYGAGGRRHRQCALSRNRPWPPILSGHTAGDRGVEGASHRKQALLPEHCVTLLPSGRYHGSLLQTKFSHLQLGNSCLLPLLQPSSSFPSQRMTTIMVSVSYFLTSWSSCSTAAGRHWPTNSPPIVASEIE